MKILNKEQFLKMPAGTVYSEYEPCVFTGLLVKGDTWPCDYIEMSLIGNIESEDSGDFANKLMDAQKTGDSLPLDFDCYGWNGMFEDSQLYAVYEKEDLEGLIGCLQESLESLDVP